MMALQVASSHPLLGSLTATGAVFGILRGTTVALHFGDEAAEYTALTSAAGLFDLSSRTELELVGQDRVKFLHGLCTQEIKKLSPGSGGELFLTNAKGHILAFGWVFCTAEQLLIDTVPDQATKLLAHLDRYIIREDVQLADRTPQRALVGLAGPTAPSVLSALGFTDLPLELGSHRHAEASGLLIQVRRVSDWGTSYQLSAPAEHGNLLWQKLLLAGAIPAGELALETVRVEQGTPVYGADVTDENLPQEVDRNSQAISFVKGCYIGQETVARIDALGHVNKTLVGVQFASEQVPSAGAELRLEKPLGRVTSAVFSRKLNAPLALAYVRRGSNKPGAALASDAGPCEVVKLPL